MASVRFNIFLLMGAALVVPERSIAQEVQLPVWNVHDTWSFSTILEGPNWNGSPRTYSTNRFTVLKINDRNYSVSMDTTTKDLGEGHQESRDIKFTKRLNTYSRASPQSPSIELDTCNGLWSLARRGRLIVRGPMIGLDSRRFALRGGRTLQLQPVNSTPLLFASNRVRKVAGPISAK